ncbi:uncharacterized protein K444DRAFT_157490 [Hyaloscypha bicolor E]|uniref:Uncharacterized protein n=1 Tax=Hyaloscypha bicolor E TaxID=1095630 RepID=A0A2J6TSC7_9HELO|nr:uncharacterized protein K444DRAFT_157490 [Hyaloscypha bicolor E]PMD65917.1 hypothetical protein K444DRAFT_157490 [Hyaloscypha bicolor E]
MLLESSLTAFTAFSRGRPVQCLFLVVRLCGGTLTFNRLFSSHHRVSALESTKARFRFSTFSIISTLVLPWYVSSKATLPSPSVFRLLLWRTKHERRFVGWMLPQSQLLIAPTNETSTTPHAF